MSTKEQEVSRDQFLFCWRRTSEEGLGGHDYKLIPVWSHHIGEPLKLASEMGPSGQSRFSTWYNLWAF
jgi:hypothetical protein